MCVEKCMERNINALAPQCNRSMCPATPSDQQVFRHQARDAHPRQDDKRRFRAIPRQVGRVIHRHRIVVGRIGKHDIALRGNHGDVVRNRTGSIGDRDRRLMLLNIATLITTVCSCSSYEQDSIYTWVKFGCNLLR
jgi:hypothetical protein